MAKTLSQLRRRDFYTVLSKELTTLLLAGPETKENALRQKRTIAPDWVGSAAEINVLVDSLREDPDALCHARATTNLMQLSFRAVAAGTVWEKTKTVFAGAIRKESDLHAAGIMLKMA